MMKRMSIFAGFFAVMVCGIILFEVSATGNETRSSRSELNLNQDEQAIINQISEEYDLSFNIASDSLENELYGIWQVQDMVGYESDMRYQWDGGRGEIYIFTEQGWIIDGELWERPVFFSYAISADDLKNDDFLKMVMLDERYKDINGEVIYGVSTEWPNKSIVKLHDMHLKLIKFDDGLIIGSNGSYFELIKIGDVNLEDK